MVLAGPWERGGGVVRGWLVTKAIIHLYAQTVERARSSCPWLPDGLCGA